MAKKGEKIVTEALQNEFGEGYNVLNQVTGRFSDGKKTIFDNVVIDRKSGRIVLINETKVGKSQAYTKAQSRYYNGGEEVTLVGKNAGQAKGTKVSTSSSKSRKSKYDAENGSIDNQEFGGE